MRKEVLNINKKLIFPVIALAVLGLGIIDVNMASADNSPKNQNTIVQKIAEKFGLKQDEVQQVFDEVRDENHKQMQAKEEERLTQLVSDRKITEEQKSSIINKHQELRAERESNKDSFKELSRDERHSQMEERKAELESWANENGIDIEYVMPLGKGHGPRGGDFK